MKRFSIFIIAVSLATNVYADVIYDGQTFDWGDVWDGYSIYGGYGYETADDFETIEDWTLELVSFWFAWGATQDIRVDIFADSGGGPGSTLYQEDVLESDITWTIAYQDFDITVYKADIPINGFDLVTGTRYWLGLQSTGGSYWNSFWLVMPNELDWWSNCYFYDGAWYDSFDYYGMASACIFELHGFLTDHEDPNIAETFPHDSDFPSGVPVGTDVTFHVTDDVSGCDVEKTTISVERGGDQLLGIVTWDDSDSLDVAFEWEPDDDYTEGVSIDVEIVTFDLAGNGPVTESWSFTTGYVNVAPASLGVIKAGFAE